MFFPVVAFQSLGHVWLFETPWTAAGQTSLSFTISWSLLKLMSIEAVMPSNHLILCHPLLPLPSVFLSIRVFSIVYLGFTNREFSSKKLLFSRFYFKKLRDSDCTADHISTRYEKASATNRLSHGHAVHFSLHLGAHGPHCLHTFYYYLLKTLW